MTDILEYFQPLLAVMNKPQKLKSILLDKTLWVADKRTRFIEAGQKVKVEAGEIVDCFDGNATHEIISTWGCPTHSFKVELQNLETDNVIWVNL